MREAKIYLKIAFAVVIVICSLFFSITSSGGAKALAATRGVSEAYEARNVWDDLQGMTADGEGLDLSVYNFDAHKNVQIITFVEFCYSPFSGKQGDFGLYAYVYNPRGADWTKNEELNKIQLRVGGKSTDKFTKYPLKYLNRSNAAGSEGLFYKFKVEMTDSQRSSVLGSLNAAGRVYEVSGIELYSEGASATDYKTANKYTYTGLAEGYGVEWAEGDTLKCECAGMDVTLTLDTHSTFYRPEGNNGKDAYTQDSLHSVYFAVPNTILSKYGGLSAVHATWMNAVTTPIFVTANETMYRALLPYIGTTVPSYREFRETNPYGFISGLGIYNSFNNAIGVEDLTRLNYIFPVENGSVENYVVSGDRLIEYMHDYTKAHGAGELVLGKFSRELFESVDAKFTDINVQATDGYTLTSEKLGKTWWQKLFGGSYVASHEEFTVLEAIHPVTEKDLSGTKEEVCDRLYIDGSDYAEFKEYCDNVNDSTVFLFRYQVTDYKSSQCDEYQWIGTPLQPEISQMLDKNAYLAQQTVNLDFDIIDVTCRKGNVETVIACVMSPMDIVPDVTPPPDFNVYSDFWIYALIIIAAAVVLFVVCTLLNNKVGERSMAIIGSFLITLIAAVLRVLAGVYTYKFAWLSKAVLPLNIICGVLAGIFVVFVVIEIVQAIRGRNDRNNRM